MSLKIITDSGCDLSPAFLEGLGIDCLDLTFRFDREDRTYTNNDLTAAEFYRRMRAEQTVKTAAANLTKISEFFEKSLKTGSDVLYIGFSGSLSSSFGTSKIVADELAEEYPDQKIVVLDSLSASAGFGLLLYLTAKKRDEGAGIDECAAYAEEIRLRICHLFTVENLKYLKAGGRVNPAVAFVGDVLGLKPLMHMDDEGHLVTVGKARGRRKSLEALADAFFEKALDPMNGVVFISHGDSPDDAETLSLMIKERGGPEVRLITDIGPVIGSHSGPGTIAIFFLGNER